MEIELIIFTENNEVIEIANENNIEDIMSKLLERFDTYIDEFEEPKEMADFLEDKGINFKIVNLELN